MNGPSVQSNPMPSPRPERWWMSPLISPRLPPAALLPDSGNFRTPRDSALASAAAAPTRSGSKLASPFTMKAAASKPSARSQPAAHPPIPAPPSGTAATNKTAARKDQRGPRRAGAQRPSSWTTGSPRRPTPTVPIWPARTSSDHAGSDGSTWYSRIQAQDYTYAYATENIYVGNPAFGGTPEGAFDWWMNSPVHRDNILSAKVTEIGIGYAYSESSTYGGYYTLNFARP